VAHCWIQATLLVISCEALVHFAILKWNPPHHPHIPLSEFYECAKWASSTLHTTCHRSVLALVYELRCWSASTKLTDRHRERARVLFANYDRLSSICAGLRGPRAFRWVKSARACSRVLVSCVQRNRAAVMMCRETPQALVITSRHRRRHPPQMMHIAARVRPLIRFQSTPACAFPDSTTHPTLLHNWVENICVSVSGYLCWLWIRARYSQPNSNFRREQRFIWWYSLWLLMNGWRQMIKLVCKGSIQIVDIDNFFA